jgi:hypothetical protein
MLGKNFVGRTTVFVSVQDPDQYLIGSPDPDSYGHGSVQRFKISVPFLVSFTNL